MGWVKGGGGPCGRGGCGVPSHRFHSDGQIEVCSSFERRTAKMSHFLAHFRIHGAQTVGPKGAPSPRKWIVPSESKHRSPVTLFLRQKSRFGPPCAQNGLWGGGCQPYFLDVCTHVHSPANIKADWGSGDPWGLHFSHNGTWCGPRGPSTPPPRARTSFARIA